jgi:fumarate reductase subunit D
MLKTSSGQSALGGLEKKLTGSVPDDSAVPGPVRKAVRLMLAGGALTAVIGVFLVIATIADKNALTDASGKKLTSGEFTSSVIGTVIVYLILVAIWVAMARMNRAGRGFARWAASALAVFSTVNAYSTVNSLTGGETLTVIDIVFIVGTLALWLIGVAAVAMLWRTESSAYFKARSARL